MNARSLAVALSVMSYTYTFQAECEALFSLARTQRVKAGQYRIWAREAERAGRLEEYRRDRDEAKRLFRDALWNINRIRDLRRYA